MLSTHYDKTLSLYRDRIEKTLQHILSEQSAADHLLLKAMRYATLNAGKRLRPILVYATGTSLGQSLEQLDLAAAAIECIHCYSLIHDDLPAMDNDSLRRGKPTCHIAFGDATAILAGDALLTIAFECLSNQENTQISPLSQLKMIQTVAFASGARGMVAGQSLDLQAEDQQISCDDLEKIHHLKTGALFKASILLGAYAANCQDENTLYHLNQFAEHLGLAFQLQDDLLDHIGESITLGKNPGQDLKLKKATYTIQFGESQTRQRIQTLTNEAIAALHKIPEDTAMLEMICLNLMNRQS